MCVLLYTHSDVEFHTQFAREARLSDQVKDTEGGCRVQLFFLFSVLRPHWKVGRQSAGVEIKTTVFFFFFPHQDSSHTQSQPVVTSAAVSCEV